MDPRLKIILYGNPEEELSLLMRLENQSRFPKKCIIISQFGDIVSCRIKRKNLDEIYNSKDDKIISLDNKSTHTTKKKILIFSSYI